MTVISEETIGHVKLIRHEGHYATFLLNRPSHLNAMNPDLIEDIVKTCQAINNDGDIRAVLLTGAGRAFSAGGDIEEDVNPLRSMDTNGFNKYLNDAFAMYSQLLAVEVPVIAAVNGHAVGGGFDLALCADIRIASPGTKMGEFFVRMGLAPEVGSYLLPRIVGAGWAKLLAFTGDLVSGEQAVEIGLAEQCVPDDQLLDTAEALVKRLAAGPVSIKGIKKAIDTSFGMSFDAATDHSLRLQYQMSQTADHAEAVTAFMEKRKPTFNWR